MRRTQVTGFAHGIDSLLLRLSFTCPSILPQESIPPFLHNHSSLSPSSLHPSSSMDSVSPNPRFSDRILRALRHPLLLLHRSHSSFFILGATANVYTVTLSSLPSCTCPDRTTPCKHILFVLIRVLGLPLDHFCLRRRTLRPSQLRRLLDLPTSPDALAGAALRERFHQLYFGEKREPSIEVEDGTTCPICLEEMGKDDKIVACKTCRNPIHEECLVKWKRSRGRRMASCVICRARWRGMNDQDQYLNLSAYIGHEETAESSGGPCTG